MKAFRILLFIWMLAMFVIITIGMLYDDSLATIEYALLQGLACLIPMIAVGFLMVTKKSGGA